jgi:TPR repeat protein
MFKRMWARALAILGLIATVGLFAMPAGGQSPDRFGMWRWAGSISEADWCRLSGLELHNRANLESRWNEAGAAAATEGATMLLWGYWTEFKKGSEYSSVYYYQRAAATGFPRAQIAYGVALENGYGRQGRPTSADIDLALKYYKASAAAGCPIAQSYANGLERWLRERRAAPPSRPAYTCHDQCRGRGPADPTARAAVYDMCMDSCAASSR